MPRPSSSVAFYEAAEAEKPELPLVHGELNTVFEGCYTSHANIKRLNRECENRLLSAETAAGLAGMLAGGADAREALAEAWRTTCFHQFHDILGGCAVGVTYREATERLAEVLADGTSITGEALATLAANVDTRSDGEKCLVVFNPLAWAA